MNLILLAKYWQYVVMLILVILLAISGFISYQKGNTIERIKAQYEIDALTAQSNYNAQVANIERLNNERYHDAVSENTKAQKQIADSYASNSAIVDSLSNTIDKASDIYITANADARAEYTAAISNVSRSCVGEIAELARRADGHVSDIKMMQQAWPKK